MKTLQDSINELRDLCFNAAKKAGWHTDLNTGNLLNRNKGEMLMLVVSEIAESIKKYFEPKHEDQNIYNLPNDVNDFVKELAKSHFSCSYKDLAFIAFQINEFGVLLRSEVMQLCSYGICIEDIEKLRKLLNAESKYENHDPAVKIGAIVDNDIFFSDREI